jgi:hypothetical protein
MYSVELYNRVRRAFHVDGMSKSEAGRVFGIDRKTVAKILKHSVPPGYRRSKPPVRPKLDPFIPIIDQILEDDRSQLKKRRALSEELGLRLANLRPTLPSWHIATPSSTSKPAVRSSAWRL